ncbi:UNVERIFIED_CONTAM: hypothetical protein Sangu_2029800 [Sesamum angustifolium]|uniref:Uncharacterized protein n=1 Tax=Sesamum angustifolium TaxID=2727405 RepID=A0AAW2LI83_9LAMI
MHMVSSNSCSRRMFNTFSGRRMVQLTILRRRLLFTVDSVLHHDDITFFSASFFTLTDRESLTFAGVMMVSRLGPGVFSRGGFVAGFGVMSTTRGDDD